MTANRRFTLRLANGKEQSFDSASAMAEWLGRHREPGYRRTARGPNRSDRRETRRRSRINTTSKAPLARYANRHSGGA
jgi:hypothetical protein